jgi:peptide/nickel transport system permease protein
MVRLLAFLVRRLTISLAIVLLLTLATFAMFEEIPNEPAAFLVDPQHATQAQIRQARHQLGVDKPMPVRYLHYVERLAHGDFGNSWQTIAFTANGDELGIPVRTELWQALGVTASVVVGGVALVLLLSFPLGVVSAARPRSLLDRSAVGVSLVGLSTHPLVVALLLQLFLGDRWKLLPGRGYCNLHGPPLPAYGQPVGATCGGLRDWASHLLLPWLTFALFFIALYSRVIRSRMMDILGEPFVRTARAKGASEWRVVRRHALPNALLPIVTMTAMDIGTGLGVAAYVETVYHLPGLGARIVTAIATGHFDVPVVIGIVFFTAVIILALNLLVDVLYAVLDPRVDAERVSLGPAARSGRVA